MTRDPDGPEGSTFRLGPLHHVSLIVGDLRRAVAFYEGHLGLARLKRTVLPEDPAVAQVYLGTTLEGPRALLCLNAVSGSLPGRAGIGGAHHFAFRVATEAALLRWKRRLVDRGLRVAGPHDRRYFQAISVRDPDGALVEIATDGPGFTVDGPSGAFVRPANSYLRPFRDEAGNRARNWPEPVPDILPSMRLSGLHHVTAISSDLSRTADFYAEMLGLSLVRRTVRFDDPHAAQDYFSGGGGVPGTVMSYFGYPPDRMQGARPGPGSVHGVVFHVPDEEALESLAGRLERSGRRPSPIRDCVYYHSLSFHDPDGQSLSAVAGGAGFTCDEPAGGLGRKLCLPGRLEPLRGDLEKRCAID